MEVLQALTVLRHRALTTIAQTTQVISASIDNLSQASQGSLPSLRNLKRTVQRQRVANAAAPANPQTLADLVIPERFTTYERQPGVLEDFFLHDNGQDAGD